jgi:hypothetical protein
MHGGVVPSHSKVVGTDNAGSNLSVLWLTQRPRAAFILWDTIAQ